MEAKQPLVVVTGAAGSLGRAVAQHFMQAGARLILVDLDQKMLMRAFEGASEEHEGVAADLTDAAQVEAALSAVLQRLGEVDVLCNIAGGFSMGPGVHETPDASWRHLMDLNVATLINTCRVVVPGMIRAGRGKIINIAAAGAAKGGAGMGAYAASKSSVARLTESMSMELREFGINVNAVAPSIIDTAPNRAAMPDVDPARWVTTDALARVVGFLSSSDASAIHGAVLPVVGLS